MGVSYPGWSNMGFIHTYQKRAVRYDSETINESQLLYIAPGTDIDGLNWQFMYSRDKIHLNSPHCHGIEYQFYKKQVLHPSVRWNSQSLLSMVTSMQCLCNLTFTGSKMCVIPSSLGSCFFWRHATAKYPVHLLGPCPESLLLIIFYRFSTDLRLRISEAEFQRTNHGINTHLK